MQHEEDLPPATSTSPQAVQIEVDEERHEEMTTITNENNNLLQTQPEQGQISPSLLPTPPAPAPPPPPPLPNATFAKTKRNSIRDETPVLPQHRTSLEILFDVDPPKNILVQNPNNNNTRIVQEQEITQSEPIYIVTPELTLLMKELPEHIISNIFEFLVETLNITKTKIRHRHLESREYQQQMQARRIRMYQQGGAANKESKDDNAIVEFAKVQTKFNLVCKSWYIASSSDTLWKGITYAAHRGLVQRLYDPLQVFKEGQSRQGPLRTYPRTAVKSKVRLGKMRQRAPNTKGVSPSGETFTLSSVPNAEYKYYYIWLKQLHHQEFNRMQKRENYNATMGEKFLKVRKRFFDKTYYISMFVMLCTCLLLFIFGITIQEAIARYSTLPVNRIYYFVTFAPLLLFIVMLFGFPLGMSIRESESHYVYRTIYADESVCGPFMFILWGLFFFIWFSFGSTVVLTLLNLTVLPYLSSFYGIPDPTISTSTWDRRIHLIPWHIIFSPVIIIFAITALVFLGIFVMEVKDRIKYQWLNSTSLCDFMQHINFWVLLATLAGFCFSLMFTLLAFHFEFPKAFHIAYSFIPLYIACIVTFISVLVHVIGVVKSPYNQTKEFWTTRAAIVRYGSMVIFPWLLCLPAIFISCHSTIIGPFTYLPGIPAIIVFFVFFGCFIKYDW